MEEKVSWSSYEKRKTIVQDCDREPVNKNKTLQISWPLYWAFNTCSISIYHTEIKLIHVYVTVNSLNQFCKISVPPGKFTNLIKFQEIYRFTKMLEPILKNLLLGKVDF
jgi:hypothetical protein